MNQYIYHLSLRKPDDEKKKFIIETDVIVTRERITKEAAEEISEKNGCDLFIQFLGYLKPDKRFAEPIDITKYDDQAVKEKLEQWEKEEGFKNAIDNKDL